MYGALRINATHNHEIRESYFKIDSFYHHDDFLFTLNGFPGTEGASLGKEVFVELMNYLREIEDNIQKGVKREDRNNG